MCEVVSNSAVALGRAFERLFRASSSRHSSADSEVTAVLVLQLAPEQVQRFERAAAFVFGARGRIARLLAHLAALDVDDDVQQADRFAFGRDRARRSPVVATATSAPAVVRAAAASACVVAWATVPCSSRIGWTHAQGLLGGGRIGHVAGHESSPRRPALR